MNRSLPEWKSTAFSADEPGEGHARLRTFLNGFADHTAFLAQWKRSEESGHVAIIEKVATDKYAIYQAQQGLSSPYRKLTKIESLLYSESEWGNRSRLRLFYR